jgi:uncharacterized cupin superfamily protein
MLMRQKGRFLLLIITGIFFLCVSTGGVYSEKEMISAASYTLTGDESAATIPDLVGLWNTESIGTALVKSNKSSEFSHYTEGVTILTGQVNITKQDGRVLHGTFTGSRGKNEGDIGVIDFDNKHVRIADMDGIIDLEIVETNTMHMIYTHHTDDDNVVAVGIWRRT